MKNLLVFGAGKSATVLIRKLLAEGASRGWHITVVDQDLVLAGSKVAGFQNAAALAFSVLDETCRENAIVSSDLVISLLPPALHILIAKDCLRLRKHLFTASYIEPDLFALDFEVRRQGLLFLCEMGLDPGIDHMSALRIIHDLKARNAFITSFRSHCGGLVAPSSDDNPWHYKISWNPANVVNAGNSGAVFLEDGLIRSLDQTELFANPDGIFFPEYGEWKVYPNRDSLSYASLYGLSGARTFVRTTIRHADFMYAWSAVVSAGLSNADPSGLTFAEWSRSLKPFVTVRNDQALDFLGLWSDRKIPEQLSSGRAVLQYLLESRLMMAAGDRDLVLMMHELSYELNGRRYNLRSSFALEGENALETAMAKTVGLPLAHAAVCFLEGKMELAGIIRPVVPEIYRLILPRLEQDGIVFVEETEEV